MNTQISKNRSILVRVMQMSLIYMMLLSSFFILFGRSEKTQAAASSTINFQARLMTSAGNIVPDGNYNIEFKLYNAASSAGSSQGSCSGDSACKWVETRLTSDKVRVVNGYMTVNLGSVTAFASTINWDQEHWLAMNIGGTGVVTWDGEMTPRLKLTAVPHALSASQLANTNGANRSTLGWATQTTSNSILLPNEAGTLCIQSSANCGFLTSVTGDANYIKLQGSTPGTPQTGNMNISGTGVFGTALQAPIFDRASAGALQIGTTNATSISLQQNTTIASGKLLTLQGGFAMTPASDSTSVFNVRTSAGNNMFTIDTQFARVGIGLGASNVPVLQDAGLEIRGSIRLSGADGTYSDKYITPKAGGGTVNSLINIVNYDPGQFGQLIAMGIPLGAHTQSRAISLFDARATAHQPTLAVFDPSQNQLGGFSWDGSNVGTDGIDSIFYTKTSSNNMALQANGLDIMSLQKVGSVARVGIGNGSPAYPLDVTGDINSSTALRVGGNVVCTSSGCSASTTLQNAYDAGNAITTSSGRNVSIVLADTATDSNFSVNMQCTTCSASGGRFEIQNAGTAVFWLNPGSTVGQRGSAVFRNTANDINAFQIQTAGGGSTVFNVDTSSGRVGINNAAPTVALDVTGDINASATIKVAGTSVCDTTGTTGCIAKSGSGFYIHNQTTAQAANLYVQAATTGTVAAKFQAFNGGSGNIAEFLNGTGTTVVSISSAGAALFKPSSDSLTAFQVQPSGSATPVFNLDTQNSRVGIGTAAPTRTFHTLVNNTQTTAPMALLEQTGAGDTTLEFKSPSKSYIMGQDASDGGKFKIASSTASASPTQFGKTSIGASEDSGDNNVMECSKFTTSSAGTAASMTAYERGAIDGGSNNLWQAAIYTDNGSGSNPVNLVASSASGALVADSWNTVNITASLAASTIYWLCANTNSTSASLNNWAYDTVAGAASWKAQTFGTWPANFTTGGGVGSATTQFSFYITYTPGGSYDSYTKSLMSLGETGQTTFQNSIDSTTAFQVQNASSTSLFSVDSTNSRVIIGAGATGSSAPAVLVLASKTDNTTDPTGVEGAMYYNNVSDSFRCYMNGRWRACVSGVVFANTSVPAGNTLTATSDTNFASNYSIPANDCSVAGRVYNITAQGLYSTTGSANMTMRVKMGTTTVIQAPTPNAAGAITSASQLSWRLEVQIVCLSTTQVEAQGWLQYTNSFTGFGTMTAQMSNTGPVSVTTTSAQTLQLSNAWSAAGASIVMRQFIVEASGP